MAGMEEIVVSNETSKETCQFGPAVIGYWVTHNPGLQALCKQEAKDEHQVTGRNQQRIYIQKAKAAWASVPPESKEKWTWAL